VPAIAVRVPRRQKECSGGLKLANGSVMLYGAMPHAQQHRGPHPEDRELFAPAAGETLRRGMQDCAYLLDRGYSVESVLDVVGRRYALRARQRLALRRALCSTEQKQRRESTRRDLEQVQGKPVTIDGFNLVIGLEVALSGGVLLGCRDGALRDLAGLRGTYRIVEETDAALSLIGEVLTEFRAGVLRVLLDRPVSNSGRLKGRILERSTSWPFVVQVDLVDNPDRDLDGREWVVSSDSLVLDRATSWVNLLAHVVQKRLAASWRVDLATD